MLRKQALSARIDLASMHALKRNPHLGRSPQNPCAAPALKNLAPDQARKFPAVKDLLHSTAAEG
jgi:hypothetical protein